MGTQNQIPRSGFTAAIERLQSAEKSRKRFGIPEAKNLLKSLLLKSKKEKKKSSIVRLNVGLQVEANKNMDFQQKARLIISKASTKKHTTYPRVDTTYLSENLYPKISGILRSMNFYSDLTAPL